MNFKRTVVLYLVLKKSQNDGKGSLMNVFYNCYKISIFFNTALRCYIS